MSIPRLHVESALREGAEIALTPAQAHHLGTVLRRAAGAELRVFNPGDGEFAATLTALRKDRGAIALGARMRAPEAAEAKLRLVLAALKREAMDWAVEKATELGATRITPVLTRRCVATHSNTERLSAIARAAAEQCERLSIPTVDEARPLYAVLDSWEGGRLLAAAERREAAPLATLLPAEALLVGPEGGFERGELDDLARRPFVTLASLGPRILRAETAAVAGLGALAFAQDAGGRLPVTKASE
ncbi:16S rRNA (uracil(1498)-N(3))-methyltransferase [Sabulicella glaciei]|uniref:Ribosomal RNA small subunit methyltransferase E n=1 Tax=Sabulicella glaciei TaxID=2984948 RepID=A0ABT3P0Q8_9PROT|nr:16S rRNA (uracil(1498)-N(3))-methyltransferase [Roseococcus sp. MDT2-1-1]MCW8087981.1 16S rRNA (uracil(1498)-N(3))-methyltransferase [Roseococcus sp. MDT2-1-1]